MCLQLAEVGTLGGMQVVCQDIIVFSYFVPHQRSIPRPTDYIDGDMPNLPN